MSDELNIVFITGAGASFDNYPNRTVLNMPLTKDLFKSRDNIMSNYPNLSGLVSTIRNAVDSEKNNFEDVLETLLGDVVDIIGNDTKPLNKGHNHRAAQLHSMTYYLRELIGRKSETAFNSSDNAGGNYDGLIDHYYPQPDVNLSFITFNYDTFIEDAIFRSTGKKFIKIDDYKNGSFPVIKLHGSVNWFYTVNLEFFGRLKLVANYKRKLIDFFRENPQKFWQQIEFKHEISVGALIGGDVRNSHYSDVIDVPKSNETGPRSVTNEQLIYPVLGLPVKNKGQFVCPDTHVSKAITLLEEANIIVIIGWKGEDPNFSKILYDKINRKDVSVCVVSHDSISAIKMIAKMQLKMEKPRFFAFDGEGFSNYIKMLHRGQNIFREIKLEPVSKQTEKVKV